MMNFSLEETEQQLFRLREIALKALDAWELGQNVKLELIKHRENAVYKVTTAMGDYVLRVHRSGYHSDEAIRSELQWMESLLKSGIATPEIIKTRRGEWFAIVKTENDIKRHQVDLFRWINSVPVSDLTTKNNDFSMHTRIGALMAGLHNQAGHWIPPENFTRHHWDEEGLLGENPIWGRFWELSYFNKKQREKILEARTIAKQQLLDFGKKQDRYGLIHCDFLPENLLKDGAIVRIIDFDDCGYGWHMFDIVTSLFAYVFEGNIEEIKSAFIQGYRSQRALTSEQLKFYNLFLLLRLMTSCGWIHTRPETETARQFGAILSEYLAAMIDEYLAGR